MDKTGRKTPTQARALRRLRRDRRRRMLRIGGFLAIGLIAFTFIFALFAPGLDIKLGGYGPNYQGESVSIPDGYKDGTLRGGTPHLKSIDESHPAYSSVPASSGWHYGVTAKWGAHDEVVVDEILVHNLEHAGIGIHYDCPSGCDELVEELVRIIKPYHKVIVSPYPGMQNKIVLTAWGYIDKFDVFDEKRILDFIEAHINSSSAPEPLGM